MQILADMHVRHCDCYPCCAQVRSLSSLGHAVLVISGKPPSFDSSHVHEGAEELIEVRSVLKAAPPYSLLPHSTVLEGTGNRHSRALEWQRDLYLRQRL